MSKLTNAARAAVVKALPGPLARAITQSYDKAYQNRRRRAEGRRRMAALDEIIGGGPVTTSIRNDIEMLRKLHGVLDPIPEMQFGLDDLLRRARWRMDQLGEKGIDTKGLDLLDVGAGRGESLMVAREYGFRSATGIDYSADYYRALEPDLDPEVAASIQYVEGNLGEMTLEPECRDLVTSFQSFEHFLDPERIMDQCHRALRTGGYFYTVFGPLFRAALGGHRFGVTPVPYLQNLFSNDVVFRFMYGDLDFRGGRNTYTGEPVTAENPFPEMNQWTLAQFEELFAASGRWRVILIEKGLDRDYEWFARRFGAAMPECSMDDLLVSRLSVILQKK